MLPVERLTLGPCADDRGEFWELQPIVSHPSEGRLYELFVNVILIVVVGYKSDPAGTRCE